LRTRFGAGVKKRVCSCSQLHAEVAIGRRVHLLTHLVVANPFNQNIVWNRAAVAGRDASLEKHNEFPGRLNWPRVRAGGARHRMAGRRRGCGSRRWRSRRLLRHCDWDQKGDGECQHDENAEASAHRSLLTDGTSDEQNSRSQARWRQGFAWRGIVGGLIYKITWWTRPGSNRRPHRCERCALPAELLAHE
jgi:hypothetical protein